MATKKILVICGTGVATSTVVVSKIKSYCEQNGLDASISQGKVSDLVSGGVNADFIVATTHVPDSVTIPVIQGLPFLTNIGIDAVYKQISDQFSA
ncbi:PTS sugar transporter subunit IIB [Humidisolicoccus flavus]|uniref:PTS sugar transporter subunit IIB n=1 Tax=Humidisolicoccus flavus TaxID=3111414 RepID=UPI0032557048